MGVSHLAIDFEFWIRELLESGNHIPIGIALVVAILAIAIGYRSKYSFLRRRDYSVDQEELRTFDEQAELEKLKQDDEQNS
jgi:hypothetical protein